MTPGPLTRLTAAFGLVALVPVAWMLATGDVGVGDAVRRGTAIAIAVTVGGRFIGWWLAGVHRRFERAAARASEAPVEVDHR